MNIRVHIAMFWNNVDEDGKYHLTRCFEILIKSEKHFYIAACIVIFQQYMLLVTEQQGSVYQLNILLIIFCAIWFHFKIEFKSQEESLLFMVRICFYLLFSKKYTWIGNSVGGIYSKRIFVVVNQVM